MDRPQVVRKTSGYQHKKKACAQARLNDPEMPPKCGKGSQSCRKCGIYGHNGVTYHAILQL